MDPQNSDTKNYNEEFIAWTKKYGVRPSEFSRKTGYGYQHSWNLLSGRANVTRETLGRIALSYGTEAVQEILGEVNGGG